MTKFNVLNMLQTVTGYKGVPYPGGFFSRIPGTYKNGANYNGTVEPSNERIYSDLGSVLRKKDAKGRWYFMPVELNGLEIPNAVISIRGKKSIVETPMVGRKGTVKELISVDDFEIQIAGVCLDSDFPDRQIGELNELFNVNESVSLKCALTDIFLDEEDKVVVKSVDFAEMRGVEAAQAFTLNLITDRSFELTIE